MFYVILLLLKIFLSLSSVDVKCDNTNICQVKITFKNNTNINYSPLLYTVLYYATTRYMVLCYHNSC